MEVMYYAFVWSKNETCRLNFWVKFYATLFSIYLHWGWMPVSVGVVEKNHSKSYMK